MKRTNLKVIGIEEGKTTLDNGTEKIFSKIIEEKYPNQLRRSLSRYNKHKENKTRVGQKRKYPQHIIVKTLNVQNKEKMLRAARSKDQSYIKDWKGEVTAGGLLQRGWIWRSTKSAGTNRWSIQNISPNHKRIYLLRTSNIDHILEQRASLRNR